MRPDPAAFDRLKTRIQGLRAKTTDNGCTEAEALLAAAKVAELLDRYDLSLTDVEIRNAQPTRRVLSPLPRRVPGHRTACEAMPRPIGRATRSGYPAAPNKQG